MTLQSFSPSLLAATLERRRRSFWRGLLDAIAMIRQLKAEHEMTKYLRRHRREHRDDFALELERRFLGQ